MPHAILHTPAQQKGLPRPQSPVEVLQEIPLFHGIGPDSLAPLTRTCHLRAYAKREYICRADEPVHMLFYLTAGLVQMGCTHDDGKESGLLLLEPGHWFGEMSLLDGHYQATSVIALEPSQALILHRGPFLELLRTTPGLALDMLTLSQRRLYDVIHHVKHTKFGSPFQRLARIFVSMASQYGETVPAGVRIRHRVTHQTLADLSGLTRETVTQTLSAFRNTQCLMTDSEHKWVVLDLTRLEREAQ
jgi:CRP-like cAMP-binding protein